MGVAGRFRNGLPRIGTGVDVLGQHPPARRLVNTRFSSLQPLAGQTVKLPTDALQEPVDAIDVEWLRAGGNFDAGQSTCSIGKNETGKTTTGLLQG